MRWHIAAALACTSGAPVFAQQSTVSPTVVASDAFGQAVGNERIGLYGPDDVRGFSPIEAGNGRIEGLYFAPIEQPMQQISDTNSVRVGIAAQNYIFPAPTGIVDYALNQPLPGRDASVSLDRGQYGSIHAQVDAHIEIDERLGLLASIARRHQQRHEGGDFTFTVASATLAWRPYAGALITPFFGYQAQRKDQATPTFFPAGDYLPPRLERRERLGQPWAQRSYDNRLYGIVARLPLGAFRIDAGLFRAERDYFRNFADLYQNLRPNGTTPNRVIVFDPNNRDAVWSGEVRGSYAFTTGDVAHRVSASTRGRRAARRFGGGQRILLGESSANFLDARPTPVLTVLPDDLDDVSQTTVGGSYMMTKPGAFSLNVAASHTVYVKTVDFNAASQQDVRAVDRPWLGSVTGSVYLTRRLLAYGGYIRGFEDPMIAPEVALNRGVAPPALRTQQAEFGLRYALTPALTLIAGMFEIKKPYYNLDGARLFRNLGDVRNRGIEVSLAGSIVPGIAVVAGTVLLDPHIGGTAVASGLVGPRPVGSLSRRSIFNVDWRLAQGKSPLSLDAAFEEMSSRTANVTNTLSAPARTNLSLGARYRFAVADVPATLRLQVYNVFDTYGWNVNASGGFTYSRPRVFLSEFQLDF